MSSIIYVVLFAVVSLGCNTECNSLCAIFNGKASCYINCGCEPKPQKEISISLKSEYINHF